MEKNSPKNEGNQAERVKFRILNFRTDYVLKDDFYKIHLY